jgi:hypothetical protein
VKAQTTQGATGSTCIFHVSVRQLPNLQLAATAAGSRILQHASASDILTACGAGDLHAAYFPLFPTQFAQRQHAVKLRVTGQRHCLCHPCRTSEGASTSGTGSSAANAGYLQQKLVYTPDGDKLLDADGEGPLRSLTFISRQC